MRKYETTTNESILDVDVSLQRARQQLPILFEWLPIQRYS